MIREDDSGLYSEGKSRIRDKKNEDLRERHRIINESDADILISIHLNFFPNPSIMVPSASIIKGMKRKSWQS